jgi:hypothetical protein
VMGRKGIGKLSLFAIAETVQVESASRAGGTRAGLVMRAGDIRAAAARDEPYYPDALDTEALTVAEGTSIRLADLRVQPTAMTEQALRRRLARRFSVIGPESGCPARLLASVP